MARAPLRSRPTPSQLAGLTDEQRAALSREHITTDLARDRALFAAFPPDPDARPGRRDQRAAQQVLPRDDIRQRAAEHRKQRHQTRKADRASTPRRAPRT